MKVIMTGGGTGGHIYPAIAIAEEIKKRHPDVEMLYVGSQRGMEKDIVPKHGIDFKAIEIQGFRRKLSIDTLKSIGLVFKGIFQAGRIIKTFKPDIVIGTGGYVCGPVVLMAAISGKKTLLHEQNAYPGVTNKILSHFVDRICISFDESKQFFKSEEKLMLSGNPVREAFIGLDQKKCKEELGIVEEKMILSTGGSGGAKKLNEWILSLIKEYNGSKDVRIVHITGRSYYDKFMMMVKGENIDLSDNIEIIDYCYDMPTVMGASDLCVSRAGASTLTELALSKTPSVLVPSPNVTGNHQEHNAQVLEKAGAALMLKEKETSEETFVKTVVDLIEDSEGLVRMADQCHKIPGDGALNIIVNEAEKLLR